MALSTLSIDALKDDLRTAEEELSKATAARLRAHEVENEWSTEVNSLKNLIEVRSRRLSPPEPQSPPETQEIQIRPIPPSPPPTIPPSPSNELTHIEWIEALVRAAGSTGMIPPEAFRASVTAGRTMHRNYPYTALATLVDQGRVVKRGDRYYAPSVTPNEGAPQG